MKITKDDSYIYTTTDYSNEFVIGARKLNGRWTGSQWKFDVRHEDKVRNLLLEVYGEDGTDTEVDYVTVKVDASAYCDEMGYIREIDLFGKSLVYRPGRDSKVKLHDSVVVTKGGFPSSGGSAKNPRLSPYEGTELEVLDVPRNRYLKELNGEKARFISLVDGNEKQKQILLDEKETLLNRIKEIDELLKGM